jgi:hypothetical protein
MFIRRLGAAAGIAIIGAMVLSRPAGRVTVHRAAAHDVSPPLASLGDLATPAGEIDCEEGCGTSPHDPDDDQGAAATPRARAGAPGAAIEQTSQGNRPAAVMVATFDGLGVGFEGPQGASTGRNPSDNSLAVGPNHVVQIVNSRMAVFDKKGKVLYGAVTTNTIFKGFGGICESRNNGDAVGPLRPTGGALALRDAAGRQDQCSGWCTAISAGANRSSRCTR